MADPHEPLLDHDGSGLTAAQLDGRHCIECDRPEGPMIPAYNGPDGQLFLHPACDDSDPELLELEAQPEPGMDHSAVMQYCAGYAADVDAASVLRFLGLLGGEAFSREAVEMAIETVRGGGWDGPFAGCRDVEYGSAWQIGSGAAPGAAQGYVRLQLGDGEPVDLTPAAAAELAGALTKRAGELI